MVEIYNPYELDQRAVISMILAAGLPEAWEWEESGGRSTYGQIGWSGLC